ncbi:MAG TPA: aspartyl/asparaginyl beta-hydroxylase domain-containing protein [Pseudolabrys sp.]|nr:aspartyl/asparaginyl beta-hydroxylase domain-containing protein [Pseudolabrys sp.]
MGQLYDRAAEVVRAIYDSRIATPATLEAGHYFPNAKRFTDRWTDIRDEAFAVAAMLNKVPRFHDIMPAQADISANDGRDWRVFIMKAYGVAIEDNLKRAPTVAAILAEAPEVMSATFSFLAPGKHIPEHRGPFRAILRYHLMLSMPNDAEGKPACVMNIDGMPYLLGDGESLLWDDTYRHEVWNTSDQVRIALLLDVWRKDMPMDIALLSRAILFGTQTAIRMGGLEYNP